MSDYYEPRRGPSFIAILIAVLLAGILVALVVGLLLVRDSVATARSGVEQVREWGVALVKPATPTVRPNPATIIREIQVLSRLETVSYSVEKVVTVEKNQQGLADLLGLDEKLLFVAHGKVIAGIDLGKLLPEDITITEDNKVILALPAAEIFVATLDNEQSYVYDHERGVLNRIFEEQSDMETLARQAAERAIKEAAIEDGILETAHLNASNYLRAFILGLGFDEVFFTEPSPDRAVTPTVSPTIVSPSPTPASGG